MSDDQTDAKYTRPALRKRIKTRLQRSTKGGRAGQWSARKSQLLVQEYERAGGGYRGQRNRSEANSLREWTAQEWQTKEGSADARHGRTMQRYLPKAAWDLLTDEQKAATERKKTHGSGQSVPNTAAAKAARAYVDHGDAHGSTKSSCCD